MAPPLISSKISNIAAATTNITTAPHGQSHFGSGGEGVLRRSIKSREVTRFDPFLRIPELLRDAEKALSGSSDLPVDADNDWARGNPRCAVAIAGRGLGAPMNRRRATTAWHRGYPTLFALPTATRDSNRLAAWRRFP